jgi:hypothetical protein
MPMDVIVTTPAHSSRTILRESGISKQRDLPSYARSKHKSPQNGAKNLVWLVFAVWGHWHERIVTPVV